MQVNYNKVLPLSNENTYYQKDRTRADKDGEERGLLFTVGETKIRFFLMENTQVAPRLEWAFILPLSTYSVEVKSRCQRHISTSSLWQHYLQ